MKTKFVNTAIAMIVLLSLAAAAIPLALPAPPALADGATWHVDAGGGGDFTSIQAAIDDSAVTDGDTIIVHDGEYNESISIDKSLTILSQNGSALTTINADDNYSCVQIEAGGVTFGAEGQGFRVTPVTSAILGIIAETLPGQTFYDITIAGNEVIGFQYGINLYNSGGGETSGCAITGNEVWDCEYGITLDSDLGLNHNNTVSGNDIYDCDSGIDLATYDEGSYVYGNTVENNDVYNCYNGIIVESWGGELHDNVIDGNEVYDCYYGVGLWNYPGDTDYHPEGYIYDNTVTGNTIHDCIDEEYSEGTGIELYADGVYGYAGLYGNTIDGNEVYDCDYGIVLDSEYDAEMYDNSVTGNTVYCDAYEVGGDGIYLYTFVGGSIYDCTVQGNTVYGWEYGIELYDESVTTIEYIDILDNVLYNESEETGNGDGVSIYYCYEITISGNDIGYSAWDGIYVYDSEDVYITGNRIHDMDTDEEDSAAIYVDDSSAVSIYGNDIRDNDTDYGGIYVYDSGYVEVTCNNLVDNWSDYWDDRAGIYVDSPGIGELNAENNWWGDESGYEYGGAYAASGSDIDAWPWLYEEYILLPDAVIDQAAVPASVSLYEALFRGYEYYYYDDIYSIGPEYTDIIVEIECQDENPCAIQYATADLASLLLDILPADFEERYVTEWSGDGQDYWDDWLDYLRDTDMYGYSYYDDEECRYIYDYEFMLESLFYDDWECFDECEDDCIECFALETFFDEEYEDEDDMLFGILLFEELRLGQHVVPVNVYSSCSWYTVYVPLAVVDFQLPLEAGWNLRSTPVTLDADYNTFGEILGLGDGLPGLEALITYNASSGLWEEPGLDAVMAPLSAYYLKMSGRDQIGFVVSRNPTAPPARQLYAGWNLVSLAAPFQYSPDEYYEYWPYVYPFRAMTPWDALYSARLTPGGAPGWSLAMNPPEYLWYDEYFYYGDINLCDEPFDKPSYYKYFYQEPWLAFSDGDWSGDEYYGPFLTPGGGYWVFMENAAELAGYSYTPYPWVIWWGD